MANLYRITPLEKKSVEYFVDAYEKLPNGDIRGFSVTETWRWGHGFREEDDPVWEYEIKNGVTCDPQCSWGCELEDLCNVYVEFSDGFTDEEKEEIEAILSGEKTDDDGRWGTTWIYDGDHNWEIEEDNIRILAPVKIDLVEDNSYNSIVEENINPYDPDNQ